MAEQWAESKVMCDEVRSRTESHCEEVCCIANLNGECVLDKCEGALIQMPPCPIKDKESRKEYYYFIRNDSRCQDEFMDTVERKAQELARERGNQFCDTCKHRQGNDCAITEEENCIYNDMKFWQPNTKIFIEFAERMERERLDAIYKNLGKGESR